MGCVKQAAAAEVVQDGDVVAVAYGCKLGDLGRVGEARHAEVAGVNGEQRAGVGGNGGFVVAGVCAVGRSDFHKGSAALPQHIGDSKAAADFHRLAARYDDFFAACYRGEA